MPDEDAKNDKDAISVMKDLKEILFNSQEDISRNGEAPDELKTPKQFQTNEILVELRKKSLLMHQLKDRVMLTNPDKKNMEKIDREIKEKEAQWRRLKSEAIRKKKRRRSSKQRLLQQ